MQLIPRIDYCDLLYLNLPEVLIRRLQMLLNAVMRRATSGRSCFCHIAYFVRDDFHWLPVKQRIQFTALMLVYKYLHDCSPVYITNLIYNFTLATSRPELGSSLLQNLIVHSYPQQVF